MEFVRVSGTVQNQDGIVHLRAEQIAPLEISAAEVHCTISDNASQKVAAGTTKELTAWGPAE
ncbi:MAG: hypothetical protein ACRD72_05870 [Candidatus Angelobacter sp.]